MHTNRFVGMNILTTCIGELPEELREAAIKEQREHRRNVNIYYPFLSDECAEALKDELMLTIWPMECSEATLYMVAVYEKDNGLLYRTRVKTVTPLVMQIARQLKK